MGSGKTEWAIAEMKRNPDKSYIFCTPYLKEFKRLTEERSGHQFEEPKYIDGRKLYGFNYLLSNGRDIAVTHVTFSNANEETIECIKRGKYTLILDEALDILISYNDVSTEKIRKDDINLLINEHFIKVDQYGKVSWCKGSYPQSKYADVEKFAKNGNLFYLNETFLVWQFPPHIFDLFEHVYVLTYMFDGSLLKPYFQYHSKQYELKSVAKDENGNYILVPYFKDIAAQKRYAELIDICKVKALNSYKSPALSKSWYKRANSKAIETIKNNLYNYLHNITKAKAPEIMWTCYEDYEKKLKGKGYTVTRQLTSEERQLPEKEKEEIKKQTKCFLSCNTRATNDFEERSVLAYLINFFPNPYIERYFEFKNDTDGTDIKIDLDAFALSTMLQWMFRSRLRKQPPEPVKIYIPSTRMRQLLIEWLNGNR